MYKFDTKWFKKDNSKGSVDVVMINGTNLTLGWQKVVVKNKQVVRGVQPSDQKLLKKLYDMGKEYVILVDDKPKPKKIKKLKIKDEPKNINEESEKVSIQEKED